MYGSFYVQEYSYPMFQKQFVLHQSKRLLHPKKLNWDPCYYNINSYHNRYPTNIAQYVHTPLWKGINPSLKWWPLVFKNRDVVTLHLLHSMQQKLLKSIIFKNDKDTHLGSEGDNFFLHSS
jgi:hypothetical protein